MGLIDLQENDEMFKDIATNCKPKDGSEFVDRENDLRFYDKVHHWKMAKNELKRALYLEQHARNEVIKVCDNKNSQGCGVKAQKIIRAGAVQYDSIPELQGVNLDEYRKMPSESWRITLDGE